MYAFTLSAENALLFFEVCHELKADTEEARIKVMEAMVKLGKVRNIVKTPMNKDEYVKHLSKHFTCATVESKTAPNKENQENA